jgi:NAD(P)-dependent dehydrogenase (short-subunit alcohol dehydrogenase family)
MNIAGSTALVTGANRGLGKLFAAEFVKRGARVYAGARDPGAIDLR